MRAFPVLVGISLLLAGCATSAPPGTVVRTAEQSTPPPPTVTWVSEAPVRMTVGSAVDLSNTRGLSKAVVTIEEVAENATCPTKAATPKNGQFVLVKLSAQRTDSATNFGMAVYDWFTIDKAGKETPATAGLVTGLCLNDGSALRLAYDSSGRTAGSLLLDAPADVTAILARNPNASPPVTVTIDMPAR
ncbi:MAG TPA: hypothetical protein PKM36_05725 [Propionibacteriaceae bacterium]|nr:hypothetical protein [Propionibacteriaceae bacterium]HPZ48812.1 hypothetical protein [Propionibacteriaceae bacterium]HQE30738.1 hypothetical protein [Propionibacteriaceae bacterium]